MSLIVNSGYKSLNLYFTQPANAYYIDDISTSGTQQLQDDSLRTDIDKLLIWISDTPFTVDVSNLNTNLVYAGAFQSNIIIDRINAIQDPLIPLVDNKVYYIRYAITSKIDPTEIVPQPANADPSLIGNTLDISLEIQGWLTRDPIEIEAQSDGTVPSPFPNTYIGNFTVYRYSQNITASDDIQYEIVTGSETGGVTATIVTTNGDAAKGRYTITGIVELVGTVTLRATYTDPTNTSRVIILEKILNVSKRRPGASASIVELTGSGFAFLRTANTDEIYPENIVITATATNIISPVYKWYETGISDTEIEFATGSTESSSHPDIYTRNLSQLNELTVDKSLFANSTPPIAKSIRVKVTSPSTDPLFEVSDIYTFYYVQEGSDALILGILNGNHSVSFSGNTSESTILNSGTPLTDSVVVAKGSTVVDPTITDPTNINSMAANKITSIIFSKSVSGIDPDYVTISNGGAISIVRDINVFPPDTFTSAEIIITATITFVGGATTQLRRSLTINAVFDGQTGTAYWLVNNPKLLIKQKNGNLNSSSISWTAKQALGGAVANYTTGTFSVYKNTTLLQLNTDYTVNNGVVTVSDLDPAASYYRAELYSDAARTQLLDQDDIQVYEEGTDGIIVFNDNTNHTLARTSTGEISSYLATNTYFSVQQGSQVFTAKIAGAVYSWNNSTKKLSIAQTLASGEFYVKSITFSSGLSVTDFNPTSGWSTKFSIRDGTDLIFEDWSNIQLINEALQATLEFELEYKKLDGTLGTQITTQRISIVKDASTIIIDVENDAHQIPFTTNNEGIYTYSGTKIQAFDSNQELQYVSPGTTLDSGQWKIVSQNGGGDITPASIPSAVPGEAYATVGDHSALLSETAKIIYTINAKTFRGTEVLGIIAGQTFTKVKNATAIYRIVGTGAIVRFNSGTYSSITLTAQKLEGGISEVFNGWFSYQLKLSDGSLTAATTKTQATSLSIAPSSNYNATNILVKLYKLENDTSPVDTADMPVIPQAQDGNLSPWIVIDDDYTAAPGDRIIADTTGGSFTILLPANPDIGDSVTITDGGNFAEDNLIIGRNGSKIVNEFDVGEESDINLDVQNTTYEFIYTGSALGWTFTATAGPKGDAGIDARLLKLEYKDTVFTFENDSSLDAATPESITITAVAQNLDGTGNISFTANAYDISNVLLGSVTLTGTGNTRTITPTNFNTISGVQDRLSIRYIIVTASIFAETLSETFSDSVTIHRLDNGSDAIVHQMYNESHIVAASTLGAVASYSGAVTLGAVFRGAINETMNWVITKEDSTGLTTQLTQPQKISTSGTISNVQAITGGWTATITNLSSISNLAVSTTTNTIDISALEDNDGRLYGGSPTSVTIQSINSLQKSIVYKVLGGTTPVAGVIGGLAKGRNNYILTAINLVDNVDTATSTVTATKGSVSIPKVFSLAKSKDGTVFAELDLSNDNINVATKQDGTDGDYTLATTNVSMRVGVINVLPFIDSITITATSGTTFNYTKNGVKSSNITNTTSISATTSIPTTPQINTLSLAVTNLTNDNGKLTVTISYLSTNYSSEFTVSKNKEGPDGQPATVYSLEASSELVYNPNTESFNPSTIDFTTYRTIGSNVRETYTGSDTKIRLEVSTGNGSWATLGSSSDELVTTRTLTTSSIGKTNKYLRYSLFKRGSGFTDGALLDREVDVIGTDGTNASTIIVDVENDSHQIPFDTAAGTGNYLHSGSTIQVFDNNTALQYVTTNPPTVSGTWTITSIVGSGITSGGVTAQGTNAEVADHSAMTTETADITYNIKAISLKGVVVDGLLGSQTFTKVIRTSIFRIIGAGSITRTSAGSFTSVAVSGQKIEGTTVTNNYGRISYQLLPGGSVVGPANSPVTINPATNSTYTSVNVKLYGPTGTEILDEANIAITQDGLDATTIRVDVLNNTHDIPVDSAGANGNMLYSGTDIKVYSNTQPMEYTTNTTLADNQWKITNITGNNITPVVSIPGILSGSGENQYIGRIPDHTAIGNSGETGKVTYTIQAKATGKAVTSGLTGVQTFAKVRRTAIYRITNAQTIVVNPTTNAVTQAKVNAQKIDGSTVTPNFGYVTVTNDSNAESTPRQKVVEGGVSTAATATTTRVVVRLYEEFSGGSVLDTEELLVVRDGTKGSDGADGIGSLVINYSNDVHLVPITGNADWAGSGGTIEVYENGSKLIYSSKSESFPTSANKGKYNLSITRNSGNTLTLGDISGANTTTATLANWDGTLDSPTSYRITAYIRTSTDKQVTISTDASIVPTTNPSAFRLVVNPGVLAKSPSENIYTPSSINIKLYKSQGGLTPVLDSSATSIGIAYATDTAGNNFSAEDSYTVNIGDIGTAGGYSRAVPTSGAAITAIRVRAYKSSTLLDEERIPVTVAVKGDKGDPGASVDTIIISPPNGTFVKSGSTFDPVNLVLNATANFTAAFTSWSVSGSGTLQVASNSSTTVNRLTPTNTGSIIVTVRAWKSTTDYNNSVAPSAQTSAVFGIIENGINGSTGKRVASGYVYFNTPQENQPGNEGLQTAYYDFLEAKMKGLVSGWQINAPIFEASTTPRKYWAASFSAVESGPNTGTTQAGGGYLASPPKFDIQQALGFTGIVTFSSYLTAGETTIDGSKITTGTVTADFVTTALLNSIKASIGTLEIGDSISSKDFNGTINSNGILETPGSSGWAIARGTTTSGTGKAVFNKVTVRGDISCDSITINNVTTTAGVSTSQIESNAISSSASATVVDTTSISYKVGSNYTWGPISLNFTTGGFLFLLWTDGGLIHARIPVGGDYDPIDEYRYQPYYRVQISSGNGQWINVIPVSSDLDIYQRGVGHYSATPVPASTYQIRMILNYEYHVTSSTSFFSPPRMSWLLLRR